MKTKLFFMFFVSLAVGFISCSNDDNEFETKEVAFNLDFSFVESGSMTRASSQDIYADFYDQYIKTKQLTPKNYDLRFTDGKGNTTYVQGRWGKDANIRLPEGEYSVTGTSSPEEKNSYMPSDSIYMRFDEKIKVDKNTSVITLTAKHESYLLLIDANQVDRILLGNNASEFGSNETFYKSLSKNNDVYWLFIRENYYPYHSTSYSLHLTQANSNNYVMYLDDYGFVWGKYYYFTFNNMTNTFDIPMMEPGN